MLPLFAALLLHSPAAGVLPVVAPRTLNDKIAAVLPRPDEEKWRTVGWRVNLMAARDEAQHARKPVFLWIMVGNPQGCT